ncbi:MAG: alpha/beta fold hydrolase [Candidatus Rifleibacteriota bacterium]
MPARPPLLLLHGICNNSNLFSIPQGLGVYLARHFDLFPYNYPVSRHQNEAWDFDFHLQKDMPRIWKSACREAGCKPFVFGYSMGGMLAMTAQATGIIDAPAIVTAASPFKFYNLPLYPPLMRSFVRVSSLTGYRTVPIKITGRILCALLAVTSPPERTYDLNLFRFLIKNTTVNVPVETFLQALMWIKKRRFTNRDGSIDYLDYFKNIQSPACLIYGTNDRIAPEKLVKPGYDAVQAKRKLMVAISNGTHMNMTTGSKAAEIADIAASWCLSPE